MTAIHSSKVQAEALEQLLQRVGAHGVVPLQQIDSFLYSQIAQALPTTSTVAGIVYPSTQAELAEVVSLAHAHQWVLLTLGQGSKLHWGGLGQELTDGVQLLVSTARLNGLIEHAVGDLTVTAEAGMQIAHLQTLLHQQGQRLGLDPAFPDQATLGGIVATADAGALRHRYGGVRDMLIGISLVRADGQRAKAGGRVVKNVAGYDLMKLLTGSYGTLGIISQVTFRVFPLAEASQTLLVVGESDSLAQLAAQLLASALTPTRFDVLSSSLVQALGLGHGLGLVAGFEGLAVSTSQQVQQLQSMAEALHLTQVDLLQAEHETQLWHQLRESMDGAPADAPVTCKIGVRPAQAIATLQQLPDLLPTRAIARIHASSGLGQVRLDGGAIAPHAILRLRDWCESHNGFLTVLEAPQPWKRQLDVWGYPGQALPLMKRIKQQFDPAQQLNPGRFVGGI